MRDEVLADSSRRASTGTAPVTAPVVALDGYDRSRRQPYRLESPPTLPDLVLSHFLRGRLQAAELAAALAMESGHNLAQIYDRLRSGIYLGADESDAQALTKQGLDEQLVALVARLQRSPVEHRDPQAVVLSTGRRGISACIAHMFSSQGVPAVQLELAFVAQHRRDGACLARQFPGVRYIVVDGAGVKSQELVHIGFILQQLQVLDERYSVVVVGDDPAAIEGAALQRTEHVVYARLLAEVMAAAGVPIESPLTERERAVLEHIAEGATNQQAATALGISIATVKTYLERAQVKLKSCDRASTVAAALRRGWL